MPHRHDGMLLLTRDVKLARLLGLSLAILAASGSASFAGPCSQQIERTQAQIDAKLEASAAAGPAAGESAAALRSRQPTPESIAAAESKLGEISQETMTVMTAAMARAREADRAGDQRACDRALAEVQRALAQ